MCNNLRLGTALGHRSAFRLSVDKSGTFANQRVIRHYDQNGGNQPYLVGKLQFFKARLTGMDRSTCLKTGSSTALASVINSLISGFVALPFTLLTIAVVFFALFLGLMLGWSGGIRDVQKTLSAPPRMPLIEHRNDHIFLPPSTVSSAPKRKMQKRVRTAGLADELVVYKNGKVIFRQSESTTLLSQSATIHFRHSPKTQIPSAPVLPAASNPSQKSPQN